jgi:hypothetical protein
VSEFEHAVDSLPDESEAITTDEQFSAALAAKVAPEESGRTESAVDPARQGADEIKSSLLVEEGIESALNPREEPQERVAAQADRVWAQMVAEDSTLADVAPVVKELLESEHVPTYLIESDADMQKALQNAVRLAYGASAVTELADSEREANFAQKEGQISDALDEAVFEGDNSALLYIDQLEQSGDSEAWEIAMAYIQEHYPDLLENPIWIQWAEQRVAHRAQEQHAANEAELDRQGEVRQGLVADALKQILAARPETKELLPAMDELLTQYPTFFWQVADRHDANARVDALAQLAAELYRGRTESEIKSGILSELASSPEYGWTAKDGTAVNPIPNGGVYPWLTNPDNIRPRPAPKDERRDFKKALLDDPIGRDYEKVVIGKKGGKR